MKNFTIKEFRIALTNLGLTKGDNIFIFPETFRLGRILNVRNKEEHYKTLLMPHDTGHIHTTINFLEERIKDLQEMELERKNNQL